MYSYHEIKTGELPADVNRPVEDHLAGLHCPELDKKLSEIRDRKLHGTLFVYDARTIRVVEADASYGIISRYRISEIAGLNQLRLPLIVVFERSVLNSNVRMGKDKGHEAG
jgi:hypothetical protein